MASWPGVHLIASSETIETWYAKEGEDTTQNDTTNPGAACESEPRISGGLPTGWTEAKRQ